MNNKKRIMLGILMFVAMFCIAMPSFAAEARIFPLTFDRTYTKYDITGDRKADKILIKQVKKTSEYGYSYPVSEDVYVNGKKCYSISTVDEYPVIAQIIRLGNGKKYLYIENGFNGVKYGHLLQYSSGKFVGAINTDKDVQYTKEGFSFVWNVTNVKGNCIALEMVQRNPSLSWIYGKMVYTYKNGKLVPLTRTATLKCLADKNKNYLTATRDIRFYTGQTSSTVAGVLKKGQKAKLTRVYFGKYHVRFEIRTADGRVGWYNSLTTSRRVNRDPWILRDFTGLQEAN